MKDEPEEGRKSLIDAPGIVAGEEVRRRAVRRAMCH
jgi:hypothetical protein